MSTSIWDGTASITQTDNTAALMTGLRIESNASLTVPASKWLTVSGALSNQGTAASLVVESGGSLLQSTASVPATVKRYIADWSGGDMKGWHLISSPVSAQPFQPSFVTNPPDATQDFYLWDEPLGLWINSKFTTANPPVPPYTFNSGSFGSTFLPGKGYLCAYQNSSTKVFSGGTLNVTDQAGLAYTANGIAGQWSPAGWNLMGNPFSCALTWNNGSWSLPGNVDALAQIWSEPGAAYVVIPNGTGIIPALQGFMVHATGNGSLTIPAAARTHDIMPWYKTSANPYIKLVAHNPESQTAQESVVTFDGLATAGYDNQYDSYFLPGYAPAFYSLAGVEPLAWNTLPALTAQTVVPFNFTRTEGPSYYIEAETMENMPPGVFLTDLQLNLTQNLVENPRYYFSANQGDNPARFLLSFSDGVPTGLDDSRGHGGIYTYENTLFVVNPGKARLEIFSLTGQRLQSMDIDSPGLFKTTLSVPTAYYVVRVTTGTKVMVQRVFIRS